MAEPAQDSTRFAITGTTREPRRLLIRIAVLLSLALLYYLGFYTPARERILQLEKQIASLRSGPHRGAGNLPETAGAKREVARLARDLQRRVARIPRFRDLSNILARVSALASANTLQIMELRPGDEKQHKGYAERKIQLTLEGAFSDVVIFLRALVHTPGLNRLADLTIVRRSGAGKLPLTISLAFSTYRLSEDFDRYRGPSPDEPRTRGNGQTHSVSLAPDPPKPHRDPFQQNGTIPCYSAARSLEDYDLEELRLVGIIWARSHAAGLVLDGDNGSHIVTRGTGIGNRGGIVSAITPTRIVVHESDRAGTSKQTTMKVPMVNSPGATFEDKEQQPRKARRAPGAAAIISGNASTDC